MSMSKSQSTDCEGEHEWHDMTDWMTTEVREWHDSGRQTDRGKCGKIAVRKVDFFVFSFYRTILSETGSRVSETLGTVIEHIKLYQRINIAKQRYLRKSTTKTFFFFRGLNKYNSGQLLILMFLATK